MFWVPERGVAAERVDRGEPGVAGPGTVATIMLEVVEERADQRRVEIIEVKLGWLFADLSCGELEQQPERVAVSGDRPGAGVCAG